LEIAQNGIGTTRPNPSVGAVIMHQQKIIGEGFTANYGGNHAEVNAINAVKNKSLLKEATIYVTLEPCAHFGKTPPCADLIVKHQFKNVVIGCIDTNSLVAGKGIERLQKANINVITGILEAECKQHHRRFFATQNKKRPYIILKWAETKDGFISPKTKKEQKPVWISNTYSKQLVHKLRAKEHAILVGTNNVIVDNPKLNVRSWTGNNPVRIILDRSLRIPLNTNIYDGSIKTIFITDKRQKTKDERQNLVFEFIDFENNIAQQICDVLQKHKLQSLIIEGGTQTLQTFIDANLWDEALVFIGENTFGNGIKAPIFTAKTTSEERIKNDILKTYTND
tara:strand:+ start:8237 stop:9250 length:1014 start_codon:yes stop_codon:yes gene_type:complete